MNVVKHKDVSEWLKNETVFGHTVSEVARLLVFLNGLFNVSISSGVIQVATKHDARIVVGKGSKLRGTGYEFHGLWIKIAPKHDRNFCSSVNKGPTQPVSERTLLRELHAMESNTSQGHRSMSFRIIQPLIYDISNVQSPKKSSIQWLTVITYILNLISSDQSLRTMLTFESGALCV